MMVLVKEFPYCKSEAAENSPQEHRSDPATHRGIQCGHSRPAANTQLHGHDQLTRINMHNLESPAYEFLDLRYRKSDINKIWWPSWIYAN